MEPKEKAEELIQRFSKIESFYIHERIVFMPLPEAKQCALIAVDEIILEREVIYASIGIPVGKFWHEVRECIEAM
jgi:hypothetical protein